MKKQIQIWGVVILGILGLAACGGSSGGGDGITPTATPTSITGLDAMKAANFRDAKTNYCGVYSASPTNTEAAFGCALMETFALGESEHIKAVLTGFGEPAADVQSSFFGTDKFWARLDAMLERPRYSGRNLNSFYGLGIPVIGRMQSTDFSDVNRDWEKFLGSLIQSAVTTSFTSSATQAHLVQLISEIQSILTKILVAKGDTSFQFTIPKEFLSIDADWVVKYPDLLAYEAALRGWILGFKIQDKYRTDFGNLSDLLLTDGKLSWRALATQLNGRGSGVRIGDLKANMTNFSDLREDVEKFLDATIEAAGALQASNPGYQLYSSWLGGDSPNSLAKLKTSLSELKTSLTAGMTTLTHLQVKGRGIKVDLNRFLSNPPNAKNIRASAGDPVVYRPAGDPFSWNMERIEFVEFFWKEFLKGVMEWTP